MKISYISHLDLSSQQKLAMTLVLLWSLPPVVDLNDDDVVHVEHRDVCPNV